LTLLVITRLLDEVMILQGLGVGLGTHLFVKIPRPGDSEVIFSGFESSVTTSLTTQR